MPKVGDLAPDFILPASDGASYSLSQFREKKCVILVFYPGDDTPVCTSQLCDYRDGWEEFRNYNVAILGISTNDMEAHKKFNAKHKFPFPLLVDSNLSVCRAYDALMFPSFLRICKRALYIIDKSGIIRYKHVEMLPIFKRSKEELLEIVKKI